MVKYSREDITALEQQLRWYGDPNSPGMYLFAFIRRGYDDKIRWYQNSFYRILRGKKAQEIVYQGYSLNSFIQRVPFEDVPLYINIFPEVVAWRLTICK
jgi:hypothetical protein